MYATRMQAMATEQIKQHHASTAAARRAWQIRRARRRTRPSVPQNAELTEQVERRRAHLRVVA
jgi:hypothetical protein